MSRHEAGRARLIAAARRAASETVAARVSLRDMARAAGLSPAACYRYFESRERLIDAVADQVCQEVCVAARAAAAAFHMPHDRLAAAARAYLAFAIDNRGAFDLAFERAEGDWVAAERTKAAVQLADLFGEVSGRPDLGPLLWGSVHGIVDLSVKGLVDLGQREQGASILLSRGEILLRAFLESLAL